MLQTALWHPLLSSHWVIVIRYTPKTQYKEPTHNECNLPNKMKHQNNLSECVFINAVGVSSTPLKLSSTSDLTHSQNLDLKYQCYKQHCDTHCCILHTIKFQSWVIVIRYTPKTQYKRSTHNECSDEAPKQPL